ncbi:MAG TPA: ABC transporter ATP-binding protein [Ignisphaera aggregans]|uniref:ABC transporter ATP-binding protein n=1 Tax=Ignisphaera aggregans TaxID=334771 RepID=A0A832YX19_9CREN|nr:ABC transporter ATP-binding protein [Ignisphaera aggregans]
MPPLIEVRNLRVYFPVKRGLFSKPLYVKAVDGVSISIGKGEVLTLVGESGCGKTTLGKAIVGLVRPTDGEILYKGKNILKLKGRDFLEYRRNVQIVHQDPYASLNPTKTVFQILSAPLKRWGIARTRDEIVERICKLLQLVGLTPPEDFLNKYPHQLSGGQRQRVVIARAVSVNPELIVADEPITMIDVSLRLGILNLMLDLREKLGTAYVFITHDFGAARYFSARGGGRIAVMYLGKIVEVGSAEDVIRDPQHPYTKVLLSAVPVPDPEESRKRKVIQLKSLDIPSPINPPPGCRFHTRCPFAMSICEKEEPPMVEVKPGHWAACWLYAKR